MWLHSSSHATYRFQMKQGEEECLRQSTARAGHYRPRTRYNRTAREKIGWPAGFNRPKNGCTN